MRDDTGKGCLHLFVVEMVAHGPPDVHPRPLQPPLDVPLRTPSRLVCGTDVGRPCPVQAVARTRVRVRAGKSVLLLVATLTGLEETDQRCAERQHPKARGLRGDPFVLEDRARW